MAKTWVIKLAQAGVDVKTAGDENLVYNSNWPLLKIYKSGNFATTDNVTVTQLIVNHDLGYAPAFWFFANQDIREWDTRLLRPDTGRAEFNGPVAFYPASTEKSFILDINPGFLTGTERFEYYIFALDITKAYQAPIIKSGGVIGPRNLATVFKIAKSGKDVSSPHLEDYVIHSKARSPLVHAVYPGKTQPDGSVSGYGFTFYHNLGYIPMFFAYGQVGAGSPFGTNNPTAGSWQLLYTAGSPGQSGFTVDEKKIVYTDLHNNLNVSLVVLKDPFTISNGINVTV